MSTVIVAEIAASHNGSIERALQTIDAAKVAGADAVKFQTFSPEQMVVDKSYVIEDGPWAGKNLFDLYEQAYTPREWHQRLFDHAKRCGMIAFSTPFHPDDVDFLERLGCPWYKIASFEMIDYDLIRYAARTGKQLIISTGMANRTEVERAMSSAFTYRSRTVPPIMLNCISSYPADIMTAQFLTFSGSWGVSDHSKGWMIPVCAAVKGAHMIEKHITLDRSGGLDDAFAMLPEKFAEMVRYVREAEAVIDSSLDKTHMKEAAEASSKKLRRSLYYARDLPAGHKITKDDLITARPALGDPPMNAPFLVGRVLGEPVKRYQPVVSDIDGTGLAV